MLNEMNFSDGNIYYEFCGPLCRGVIISVKGQFIHLTGDELQLFVSTINPTGKSHESHS